MQNNLRSMCWAHPLQTLPFLTFGFSKGLICIVKFQGRAWGSISFCCEIWRDITLPKGSMCNWCTLEQDNLVITNPSQGNLEVHIWNPRTQKAVARGSWIQGQLGLIMRHYYNTIMTIIINNKTNCLSHSYILYLVPALWAWSLMGLQLECRGSLHILLAKAGLGRLKLFGPEVSSDERIFRSPPLSQTSLTV